MKSLFRYQGEVEGLFHRLLERVGGYLPDLGRHLAVHSKGISYHGRPTEEGRDGRRDVDGVL